MQPNPDWIQMDCRLTSKPVCLVSQDMIPMVALAPFGECIECKSWIHESALDHSPGMDRASYPLQYIGYTCIECSDESAPAPH